MKQLRTSQTRTSAAGKGSAASDHMRRQPGGAARIPVIVTETLQAPGRPLDPTTRQLMETGFDHDFSRVQVHTDAKSKDSALALGASAYTFGNHVVFGPNRYAPKTCSGHSLLAHELAHVVQHGARHRSEIGNDVRVSSPHHRAERKAEQIADAIDRGAPVPSIDNAPANMIYRAVESHGGSWDTTAYTPINVGAGVGKVVGARIALEFTPNSLVTANTIGLTQTVNTLRSTAAGGPVSDPSAVSARNTALSLTSGDIGRAIDQGDPTGDTIPNTNPLYAVENAPGSVSATLTDVGATAAFGTHGHRTRRPDNTFDVAPATLNDSPRRTIAFVGQEWRQTFESTALVLDGQMRNTYLGSVEWGWRVNAAGDATLDPVPISLARAGVPSAEFMAAAAVWNAATFTDPSTGTVHDTVDLPTTSGAVLGSGGEIASKRTTKYLLARIAVIEDEIAHVATGAEVVNKRFERRALVAELLKRFAKVSVRVNATEDWLGADEVYVEASSQAGSFRSATRDLNDGDHYLFLVPLKRLWSADRIAEPIHIRVFDEDLGTFLDRDDLIVHMLWPSPFDDFRNSRSYDGADYGVSLSF